jgi:transcriptional regulator with XRE-family HTH domain
MSLASVRCQLGSITRKGLAAAAGVSLSHISLVLDGKRNPSIRVARAIAGALGCSTDDLLEHLERQHPPEIPECLHQTQRETAAP